MKNLKLPTLLFLVLFSCLSSSAQERQNATTVSFTKKSDQLTDAIGWSHCKYAELGCTVGTWMDNKNQISVNKEGGVNSHEPNFSWIQMATAIDKGQTYHVLYYQTLEGDYEYPLTQVGWGEYKRVYIQIINADEYKELKSAINKKDGTDLKILPVRTPKYIRVDGTFNEADVLNKVTEILASDPEKEYNTRHFLINAQTTKGGDVVRFQLPGQAIFDDLKESYFEVSLLDFKKLLID